MGKKIPNGKKYEPESEDDFEEEEQDFGDEDIADDDDEMEEEDDDEQDYQSNSDILDNDDDDSAGSDVAATRAGAFGNKKQDYYKGSDVSDSEDSAEEAGADEIYKEQQQGLTEADFMDDDFAKKDSEGSDDEDSAAPQDPEKAKEEEKERKQKLIKKLSPEIMSLAQEMHLSISEIIDKLIPILDMEDAKKIMTGKGQNYLEIRYELLISYTMCILFYLLLKAKGKITNNHPVLDKLTKYKTLIERMNISLDDFETKIGEVIANNLKSGKKKNAGAKSGKAERPLTFEEKMKLNQKQQKKGGKETEQQKLARELQEELKNMQDIYGDDGFDEFDEEEDIESEEDLLSEDEEDIRITKGAKAVQKPVVAKAAPKGNKKDDGEINMDSVEPWMLDDEDEGDMLLQEPKKVNLKKIQKQEEEKKKPNSEEYEDDFYKQVKQQQLDQQISKKQQKILEKEKKKEAIAKRYEVRELGDEDSRKATQQIILNKGNLVRKRKSIDGNARVKNRMKYERKMKIHMRNHRGKVYDKQTNYSGEMGAIKSSLIKSTKL